MKLADNSFQYKNNQDKIKYEYLYSLIYVLLSQW